MVEQRHEIILNFVTSLVSEGIDQLNSKLERVKYTLSEQSQTIAQVTQKFDSANLAIDSNTRKQELLNRVATKFNVSLLEAERGLSSVGIAFDDAGRPIDAVTGKLLNLEEVMDRARRRLKRFRAELLSILFGMRMLYRAIVNFIKAAVATYEKAFQKQSEFAKATNKLRAAWEFFKFALIDTLTRSKLFVFIVDILFQIVNFINELITARPELAQWIAFGLIFVAIISYVAFLIAAFGLLLDGLAKAGVIGTGAFSAIGLTILKCVGLFAILAFAIWGIIELFNAISTKEVPKLFTALGKIGVAFGALIVMARLFGIKFLAALGPIGWIILAISALVWFLALNWRKAWLGMQTIVFYFVAQFLLAATGLVWIMDKILAAVTFGKVRLNKTFESLAETSKNFLVKTKESMEEFARVPLKIPIVDELKSFGSVTKSVSDSAQSATQGLSLAGQENFLNLSKVLENTNSQMQQNLAQFDLKINETNMNFSNFTNSFTTNLSNISTQVQTQMPVNQAYFTAFNDTVQIGTTRIANLNSLLINQSIPAYQVLNGVVQQNIMITNQQILSINLLITRLDAEISRVSTLIRRYRELAAAKREAAAAGGGGGIIGGVRRIIGLQKGGYVERAGLFYLHKGETVIPAGKSPSLSIGAININISGAYVEPTKLAKEIREEIEKELIRNVGSVFR